MTALTVIGARPQFIKAATVSQAIVTMNRENEPRRRIREILVHTGQHYDKEMSDVFFRELEIPSPAHQLGIGSGSHGEQTGRMLGALERIMSATGPDCVIVYGDTNSTLAAALAASKLRIPIAHVEAGLRSFNKAMPEEINRVLTDHMACWLFCPTDQAVKNLSCEGVSSGVHLVGDVMADSVRASLPIAERESRILQRLDLAPKQYILATVHRAENTDDKERLTGIVRGLALLERPVLVPCHPRTRKMLDHFGLDRFIIPSQVRLIDPVGYLDMLRLESQAKMILTDSGGVQKEAFWLSVPCVTLRDETEWNDTVDAGWNRLAGTCTQRIVSTVKAALDTKPPEHKPHSKSDVAKTILKTLVDSVRARL
ncbi:MAG: UDP-N-acetylglucosamine 2-epimerase (non-hydrolyzing) [Nitrospira sp.]